MTGLADILSLTAWAETRLLPVALATVMFAIGLGLSPGAFRRVASARRAFLLGTGSMLLLVPAYGIGLALAFAPTPALAIGLILLATCPSGILSNVLTDAAKGDVALSISISLALSVAYIFALPAIVGFALGEAGAAGLATPLPIGGSLGKIFGVTALPVASGMLVRHLARPIAERLAPPLKRAASVALVAALAFIVIDQTDVLRASFGPMLAIITVMNLGNVGIAWAVGLLGGLDRRERVTITVEHLIRQEGTAIFVAVALIGRADIAVPMIVNTFLSMAVCLGVILCSRRRSLGQAMHWRNPLASTRRIA